MQSPDFRSAGVSPAYFLMQAADQRRRRGI